MGLPGDLRQGGQSGVTGRRWAGVLASEGCPVIVEVTLHVCVRVSSLEPDGRSPHFADEEIGSERLRNRDKVTQLKTGG